MSPKENNSAVQSRQSLHGHGKIAVIIILAILVVAFLLPGTLFDDEETTEIASDAAQASRFAIPEAPEQVQELSPQALEDLRSVPIDNLTIDPEPLLLEPVPEENGDVADSGVPETPEEDTQGMPEEPFSVGEALARYLLAVREELNSEYVANCIRFRNRNGAGADCPEDPAFNASSYQQEQAVVDDLFAIITREGEYARISSRLESENETLVAILSDPGNPAALQASTKLALNNSYLAFLNGNPSPEVATFNTMNNFINDYNRTIRVGPTQFICQDGPCVYEYTGPQAQ